jgi:hypothetical protein
MSPETKELYWHEKNGEGEGWFAITSFESVVDVHVSGNGVHTTASVLRFLNSMPRKVRVMLEAPHKESRWCVTMTDRKLYEHLEGILWHDGENVIPLHPRIPRMFLSKDELIRHVESRRDYTEDLEAPRSANRPQQFSDTDISEDDEEDDDDTETDLDGFLVKDDEDEVDYSSPPSGEDEEEELGSVRRVIEETPPRQLLIRQAERVREEELRQERAHREAKRAQHRAEIKRRKIVTSPESVQEVES